jgi:hypothetical protein
VHQHGFDLVVTGVRNEHCIGTNTSGAGGETTVAHEAPGFVDVACGGFGGHISVFDGMRDAELMRSLMHKFSLGC